MILVTIKLLKDNQEAYCAHDLKMRDNFEELVEKAKMTVEIQLHALKRDGHI